MKLNFWSLLILVLIFGLGVGAAFAAGIAFQQSRAPQAAAAVLTPSTGTSGASASPGGTQGRSGQAGSQDMTGRGMLSGTVGKVEGRTITLTTQQGSSQVVLQDGASIQRTSEASLEDLKQGARITVSGERKDDGSFSASSLQILPTGR